MTDATVIPIKHGRRRAVLTNRPPALDRAAMSLTQIYEAGRAGGSEPTGVWAVFAEARKPGSVIDSEGRYIGVPAVTTPWPMRSSEPLANEALPTAVYDAFKAALGGGNLEQALSAVSALGRASAA